MKTLQIEDAKTRFFATKEDYLKFRQAWKDFHNNGKLVWYEDVDVTYWLAPSTADRVYAKTKFTALGPEHYMLYNLLRGYPADRGFTPAKGEDVYCGLAANLTHIMWNTRYFLPKYMDATVGYKHLANYRKKLALPFGELPTEVYVELSQILEEYLNEEVA